MHKTCLYCRTSSIDQKTDRQRVNEKDYDLVIEDKVSGAVPFFDREGGKEIQKFVDNNIIGSLHVWTIDRLGRNLRDILNTIHYFSERGIAIHFVNQGLVTLDGNGKENPIAQLIISVLGIVAEMERTQSKERQMEGIHLAKLKGIYKGRKLNSSEDTLKFLSKEKNKKALDYLKKGYKASEIEKILGLHRNTITKVKKLGMPNAASV
ncbi:recombinase family protein [Rufibacter immobilis]|uniref:Recombinase family protein n=1 Tax=Rufibacter immobilis TaxID=1348778 RepID=A0A3M9MPA5_9BACT|nr:recombinase family protein [Rufibacter immobilis]RNI27372.1 recombinase family protein [Rufibacter immobilis]